MKKSLALLKDPEKAFREMLGQWSFVPSAWANQLGHLKDRFERYGSMGHLTNREIYQINRAYKVFCYYRGPKFVQGGAPGLGKRSSKQFDPRRIKEVVKDDD